MLARTLKDGAWRSYEGACHFKGALEGCIVVRTPSSKRRLCRTGTVVRIFA